MSGPKVIDYQAVERQRAETARRRWFTLCGRAEALRRRCADAGHPECAVVTGPLVDSSAADLERRCGELESVLEAAADELVRRQFADRAAEVAAVLSGVLADLDRREQQAAAARHRDAAAPHPPRSRATPALRSDLADKVTRQLATLQAPSPELEQAAAAVLTEADPARAQLRYDDLKHRIAEANDRTALKVSRLAEIAELRAQLDALADPAPLRALLDQASDAASRGEVVDAAVRQARGAITRQLDDAAANADREYVHTALADSLRQLGYEVADVDVATPESLVFRQNSTHGVRADVSNGRIDIRAVRLGSPVDPVSRSADRDTEDEFCNRIPGLLNALRQRGVAAEVTARKLPGLFTPQTVAVREKDGAPTAAYELPRSHRRNAR